MRRWKIALLTILVLLAAVAGFAWLKASALAEYAIRDLLAKQNIPVESLRVVGLSTRSITLADLALGEGGAVRAKQAVVTFDYDWTARTLGAFDATLEGVQLRAQLQDGEILLGGIERAWSTALITPNSNAIAIALDGDVTLAHGADGDMNAALTNGQLTLMQQQKNMLLPLILNATAQSDGKDFTLTGNFHNDKKNVDGTFDGRYALEKKTGRVTWNTKPMRFAEKGFTFAQLSPAFADGIATIATQASLSGVVDLKPGQWTVTPKLTLVELPIDTLLASALGEGAAVRGSVKGTVPIRIMKGGAWRIEKSRLINIGPMEVKLNPAGGTGEMLKAHPQAELVKGALSNLQVETLTLDVQSIDAKGGVKLDWHFLGRNPDFMGGKPVDLTLAVTLNVSDMWKGMQQVKRATKDAERLLLGK